MGVIENIIETKTFGKLINKISIFNGFAKSSKIRIFKIFLMSKVNHLLPLIALSGNLEASWKCIRKIIFRNILDKHTLPLETAVALGLGYYNIIIRPLIKFCRRYKDQRNNNDEEIYLKESVKRAILYWIQIERKQVEPVLEVLLSIANGQTWLNEDELDKLIYANLSKRLMRMNDHSLVLQYSKILKFPNINYNLSNAPYHEIIDTAIIITNLKIDKERHYKYHRILNLVMLIAN